MMRGAINHIDLTVLEPARSRPFYEAVLGFMGYRCVNAHDRGFDFDLERPDGGFCSVGIMRADGARSWTHKL